MTLDDLPTPCLVLDLGILKANLARMQAAVARHPGLVLRPHMKTAKSLAVADLAAPGKGPITVSTVAEARYFAGGGFHDQIYAVGVTPAKLDAIAALNALGGDVKVITDDIDVAAAIAAHPGPLRALVEVDCGEGRGGVTPDSNLLTAIGGRLGARCAGIMTHAGHSYAERSTEGVAAVAEAEHRGAVLAAERLRAMGATVDVVSLGSSPTALHGRDMAGITDIRAGVYMFGDLFQAQIGTHGMADIAVTVLTAVTGRKPNRNAVLVDAGAIALSKDRSTEKAPKDYGFGLMLDLDRRPSFGDAIVARTHQEHGEVRGDGPLPFDSLTIGALVRIAPNHTCLTVAAHDPRTAKGTRLMFILIGIWALTTAATGFAIHDLTGNEAAAYAAAALPLLFAVTGLMPNGAWALPALAVVWALTARALPPGHAAPPTPVTAAGLHLAG